MQKQEKQNLKHLGTQFFQQIKNETYKKFNQLFQKKFKKKYDTSNVYTVICSIGIINKNTKTFDIISLANGTKSLPYSLYSENKSFLLKDLHAEILTTKAFRKFIVRQIQMEKSLYFIKDLKKNKLNFDNENYEIFMFSSEPFCGDCSINQQNDMFSGSKPLKYFNCSNLPHEKYEKYILRTKPGRVDLPQNKKSLSLCCSDKLGLYNIIGLQGKQLFRKIIPIYIDFYIVQNCKQKQITIKQGLNFVDRLSKLRNQSEQIIKRKIFNIIIDKKQKIISNQFRINNYKVICLQKMQIKNKHLLNINQNKNNEENQILKKKQQKQGFQVSLIYTQGYFEWINSKTGLPQGCSLNSYMKKGKVSLFCKQKFMQEINKINQKQYQNNQKQQNTQFEFKSIQQTFKYSAIKDRIKLLFGIWTDNFKNVQHQQKIDKI